MAINWDKTVMVLEAVSAISPPPIQREPSTIPTDDRPSKTCRIFRTCCPINSCVSRLTLRIKNLSTCLCSCLKRLCAKISHAISSFFKLLWQSKPSTVHREQSRKSSKQDLSFLPKDPSISQKPDKLGWIEVKERCLLSQEIKPGGRVVASETAEPIPTRECAEQRLLKAKQILEQSLPGYAKNILQEICAKALCSVQGREQDWVHSSGIRETFERGNLKKIAFVEQVNCYRHGVNINDGQRYELLRLGTMVHTNGFTDLETLAKAVKEQSSVKKVARLEKIIEQGFFIKKKEPLTECQKRGLELAIIELKDPRKALTERRFLFEQQMLFLINQQVQSYPPQGDSFILWHQSLLNPSKKKFEESGWMHNEKRELKDLLFIFKEFDGKKICFGNKDTRPYISERGTIHLPAPDGIKPGKRITLTTRLINVSVQNHKKKALEFQQKVNKDCVQQLEELIISQSQTIFGIQASSLTELSNILKTEQDRENDQKKWVELQKVQKCIQIFTKCSCALNNISSTGDSCFDLATKVAQIPLLLKAPFSTGCLSAKDRTGFLVGRLMISLIMRDLEAKSHFLKKTSYETEKETILGEIQELSSSHLNRALEEDSLAMALVRENCPDQIHLKVKVFPITTAPRQALGHAKRYLRARLSLQKPQD
jgi:hypothetical protein